MPVRTALLVFDGCDLLDVGGPYEVLLTANRLAMRSGGQAPFEVVTVAPDDRVLAAYGGLGLRAQTSVADLGPLDLVVVPGLIDLDAALGDDALVATVAGLAARSEVTASVCTGSFLLAAAGVLRGRRATTHHEDADLLAARDDVGEVVTGQRWVDDGDVVTGAGLSSGLALGLHLVDRFAGRDLAVATARQIEHAWDPEGLDQVV
ncbi:MAG: DJ-1/PfpI family protein [Actinobacteria bacterium]|jgi:transcriptional regulator GlxA family with amidase domain|nr:DJ-1/PfpI family protein [Actinomycetota bacterium]